MPEEVVVEDRCGYCHVSLAVVSEKLRSQGWKHYNLPLEIGYCDKLCRKAHQKELKQR